ncbi:hypothetical protein D3C85_1841370 [compost metagenome]
MSDEQDVAACINGLYCCSAKIKMFHNGSHGQIVRNHHALVSHITAKLVSNDNPGQRRRVVGINLGE